MSPGHALILAICQTTVAAPITGTIDINGNATQVDNTNLNLAVTATTRCQLVSGGTTGNPQPAYLPALQITVLRCLLPDQRYLQSPGP